MARIQGTDPAGSVKGWQGNAVDVEIERYFTRRGAVFRWSLYHRADLIRSGTQPTKARAARAAAFAKLRYRLFRR
ncbi:hypothetical protein AB0F93_00160 [Micromonospora tulbaghiae]|uniref:hypothetical protein n=1 Tax=Micromonospora tulbaghiae TaxID=479978 RepID=UPI003324C714